MKGSIYTFSLPSGMEIQRLYVFRSSLLHMCMHMCIHMYLHLCIHMCKMAILLSASPAVHPLFIDLLRQMDIPAVP